MGIQINRIHESLLRNLTKQSEKIQKARDIFSNVDVDSIEVSKKSIKTGIKAVYNNDVNVLYNDGKYVIEGYIICTGNYMDLHEYVLDGKMKITGVNEKIIDCLPGNITNKSIILFYSCDWMNDNIISSLRSKYGNDKIISINKNNEIGDYLIDKFPSLSIFYLFPIRNSISNIAVMKKYGKTSRLNKVNEIKYNSDDIFDFIYIDENVDYVYFDVSSIEDDSRLTDILYVLGDKLRIRLCNTNLIIYRVSENTILGLPEMMPSNVHLTIFCKSMAGDIRILFQKYIEKHSANRGDGSNKYFGIVQM